MGVNPAGFTYPPLLPYRSKSGDYVAHCITKKPIEIMAQISGRVIEVFVPQSGENERGEWIRGGIVIETLDTPAVKVAFSTFGKRRTEQCTALHVGEIVYVEYNPESRQFGDKWYTDLRIRQIMVANKPFNSDGQ